LINEDLFEVWRTAIMVDNVKKFDYKYKDTTKRLPIDTNLRNDSIMKKHLCEESITYQREDLPLSSHDARCSSNDNTCDNVSQPILMNIQICYEEKEISDVFSDTKHGTVILNTGLYEESEIDDVGHVPTTVNDNTNNLRNSCADLVILPSLIDTLTMSNSSKDEEDTTIVDQEPGSVLAPSGTELSLTASATTNAAVGEENTEEIAETATTTTTEINHRPNRYCLSLLLRVSTRIMESVWFFSPLLFFLCLFFPFPAWTFFTYLILVLVAAHVRFFCVHRYSAVDHTYSMSRIVSNIIRRECTEVIKLNETERCPEYIHGLQQNSEDILPQHRGANDPLELITTTKKLFFSKPLLPRQTRSTTQKFGLLNWKLRNQVTETDNNICRDSGGIVTGRISGSISSGLDNVPDLETGRVTESIHSYEEAIRDELKLNGTDTNNKLEEEKDESDDEEAADDDDKYDVGEGCDICMTCFEVGDIVTWSRNPECGHTFHEKCIVGWLCGVRRKLTCPCCRYDYFYEVKCKNQNRSGLGWIGHSSTLNSTNSDVATVATAP
jgi:hypothetical protein